MRATWQLARLFRCIRWADVLILQGAPILGVASSIGIITTAKLKASLLFGSASFLLVTHIFTFNDWAELAETISESGPARPPANCGKIPPHSLLFFSLSNLATSLLLFLFLSSRLFFLAAPIAALGIFYSHPSLNAKSMPIVSTLLHFIGGLLYFLLGYALFSAIDRRGLCIGLFFGLTFAAGHPVQEVRDFLEDRQVGATTNAIVFGLRPTFFVGVILFTLEYLCLFALAWLGLIPRFLIALPIVLCPIHIWWSVLTLRSGLTCENITRFQSRYRLFYVLTGLGILAALLFR